VGLLIGGTYANRLGKRISFRNYKRAIGICYLVHGGSYVVFSQMPTFGLAVVFLALSRAAIAVSSVLNISQLLRHVPDEFRGRVFATIQTMSWSMMMLSMMGAGIASRAWSPRAIGAVSGLLSSSTAFFWLWAHSTGRLPEPMKAGIDPQDVEVHGDPVV
ncbi:MAG TPA: MFS transporter, partial [Bryobacteraceae bacterium]|nr:MFS transporter [Bryobacteraceae bacterium]